MVQKFVNIIGTNAIFQSLLLSVFFWINKRGFRASNRILAFSLFSFGLLIFSSMPGASYGFSEFYKWGFVLRQTSYLIAPLFFLYTKSIVKSKFEFKWYEALHFLPFLITMAWVCYQGFVLHIWGLVYAEEYYVHTGTLVFQNIIYILCTYFYLKKNNLSLRHMLTNSNGGAYNLLKLLIIGFSVFWLVNFQNLMIFQVFKIYNWCPYASSVYCLTPFLFLSTLTLFVLIKPDLVSKTKNGNGRLSEQRSTACRQQLIHLMHKQEPFLNPDLSIKDLAQNLTISSEDLSYVLNKSFNKTFYDFINGYRIDTAKKLPSSGGKLNILEIAYQIGFNSKSTFNAAFKRHTGMTPNQFRKQFQDSQ